jgi:hypothetical protein
LTVQLTRTSRHQPRISQGSGASRVVSTAESARVCAPSADFPLTFDDVWLEDPRERMAQIRASMGVCCPDCAPEDHRAGEWVRLAAYHRCRCGEPTRWYHVADAVRRESGRW